MKAIKKKVYIVKTISKDWLWGDSEEFEVRTIRQPHMNIPFSAKEVKSFEAGIAWCKEKGYDFECLEQHDERMPKPDSFFCYGTPTPVNIK